MQLQLAAFLELSKVQMLTVYRIHRSLEKEFLEETSLTVEIELVMIARTLKVSERNSVKWSFSGQKFCKVINKKIVFLVCW